MDIGESDEMCRVLAKRIRAGDEKAFDTLFLVHYNSLCRFAWRYVKSEAIAEELVQDVFTCLWEIRFSWNPLGTVRGYLYKSVKHRAINYLKHQEVVHKHLELGGGPVEEYTTIELEEDQHEEQLKEAIARAIETLPERGRMVFKLHRYDGLTYKEIAQVMDISVKTVENHMTRVLKLLREEVSYLFPIFAVLLCELFIH